MRIGLFDLDGTITRRDTLLPYVWGFCLRHPGRLLGFLKMPGALLRFLLDRDRGRLKQALIQATLRGVSRSQIVHWNARWVPRLLAKGTYAQALKRIQEHREHGDYLILMSASPDLYVPAIARALGINETICTGVRWNGMRLEGDLTTPNRRGEEKLHCVQNLRQRHSKCLIAAYANSASDLAHMRACDRAFLVNAPARANRLAAHANIDVGWSWQG